jgi:hypothetical protein|tara:strand:+ start:82 stop:333 length:252 start_codon:yes stop_codon:yes gene_type:complete
MTDRWTSVRSALHRAESDAYHASEDIKRALKMLDRAREDLHEAQLNLTVSKARMQRLAKLAAKHGEEHEIAYPYGVDIERAAP